MLLAAAQCTPAGNAERLTFGLALPLHFTLQGKRADGSTYEFPLNHTFNAGQIEWFKKGESRGGASAAPQLAACVSRFAACEASTTACIHLIYTLHPANIPPCYRLCAQRHGVAAGQHVSRSPSRADA